jgi:hypothetical protein
VDEPSLPATAAPQAMVARLKTLPPGMQPRFLECCLRRYALAFRRVRSDEANRLMEAALAQLRDDSSGDARPALARQTANTLMAIEAVARVTELTIPAQDLLDTTAFTLRELGTRREFGTAYDILRGVLIHLAGCIVLREEGMRAGPTLALTPSRHQRARQLMLEDDDLVVQLLGEVSLLDAAERASAAKSDSLECPRLPGK